MAAGTVTNNVAITIEIFSAPHCSRCDRALQLTQQVLRGLNNQHLVDTTNTINVRKLDVVQVLDYAVSLGVLATPSIAINGVLIFTATPSAAALRKAILAQININK
jgi:thioredoxin